MAIIVSFTAKLVTTLDLYLQRQKIIKYQYLFLEELLVFIEKKIIKLTRCKRKKNTNGVALYNFAKR